MLEFENIKNREKKFHEDLHHKKDYFGSEQSKIDIKKIKEDKKRYLSENPIDYPVLGVETFKRLWCILDREDDIDKEIYTLVGKGKFHENNNEYTEAIKWYTIAKKDYSVLHEKQLQKLVVEHGEGEYLLNGGIQQRIRVCETAIKRSKIKELEEKAKELEKINPVEAIEVYNELNIVNPGLKKYNKRIEICKRK